ncbi:alpha/beta fold hydrolase [Streptomyces sp. YS415]|uniref:alpha/beta fold hydrolase n=1 Tax=Streptomyces sp. YS415 TaxID=2944806 RepID=UPI002020504A|nr:alpha/beta hydrolase [Streptomyces sp. YS415]MCL7430078.1 alpha/beta hydrolase [Streptomyces sp. YS415]
MSAVRVGQDRRLAGTVITDDGAEIVVYAHGSPEAEATVVLSHGWTMSAIDWRPHIDALTRPRPGFPALRAVSYDQRGHGRSTRGQAPLDMALLGRDLDLVLRRATAPEDGPVLLVGHSMGGMAVQQLAAGRPELIGPWVSGVALFSTCVEDVGAVPFVPQDRAAQRRAHAERLVTDGMLRSPGWARAVHRLLTGPLSHPSAAPIWHALFGRGPGTDTARADAHALRTIPPLTVAEFFAALTTHDCAGRLGALGRVPTRILVGALDSYTPPAQALRLADDIPGATLHTVPKQGHDLPYERPVLVVETVHALLRDLRDRREPDPSEARELALETGAER